MINMLLGEDILCWMKELEEFRTFDQVAVWLWVWEIDWSSWRWLVMNAASGGSSIEILYIPRMPHRSLVSTLPRSCCLTMAWLNNGQSFVFKSLCYLNFNLRTSCHKSTQNFIQKVCFRGIHPEPQRKLNPFILAPRLKSFKLQAAGLKERLLYIGFCWGNKHTLRGSSHWHHCAQSPTPSQIAWKDPFGT